MRDAGGKASGGGEFFGVAKCIFCAQAGGGFGFGGPCLPLQQGDVTQTVFFTREGGVIFCGDNV